MNILARVELHGATLKHYELLHATMKQARYSRAIQADSGKRSALPTGTYWSGSYAQFSSAYTAAKNAAASVGLKYAIVVAETTTVRWDGLEPVSIAEALAGF